MNCNLKIDRPYTVGKKANTVCHPRGNLFGTCDDKVGT